MCRRSCDRKSASPRQRSGKRWPKRNPRWYCSAQARLTAIFAVLFFLLTVVYALALVMPSWSWAAALIVGAALAVVATLMLTAGVRRFKQIHPTPERTVETIKENVEWAKQQAK